jgi:hypothetical protein
MPELRLKALAGWIELNKYGGYAILNPLPGARRILEYSINLQDKMAGRLILERLREEEK